MTALQTSDQFISTILKTKFNLLKAYENAELSIGQIAQYLDISQTDVLTLLEKYEIPFIDVDEEYLENEINAFN